MNVWLVVHSESESGSEAIKGLFDSEQKAKLFIADYVLKNAIDTSFLELAKKKVEVEQYE